MKMVVSFAQKYMIICLSIALCFIFFVCPIYSQNSGEKYINSSEYIHFVNDTFIEFMLIRSIQGAIATKYYGVGKYEFENDQLLIFIGDYKMTSLLLDSISNCTFHCKVITDGIDKYKIEILTSEAIRLVGPIIDDFQKYNRRRYMRSFLNWPWNWRFKNEQQWYNPRKRELVRE